VGLIIHDDVTDNVFGAVWLGALILTYQATAINNEKTDIAFTQSEIRKTAQRLCSKTVQPARVSQWCNGDHQNSSYNYLRAVGGKRRLTKIGEFSHKKEYPESLLNADDWVIRIKEGKQEITYKDLLEWYKTVYSNSEESPGKSVEMDTEPIIRPKYTPNKEIGDIEKMGFKKTTIRFEGFDKENLFAALNNKTLEETIGHYRYARLADEIKKRYPHHTHYKIGDFLLQLKKSNDNFYKRFLNPYGDEKYCKFKIVDKSILNQKGLYYFAVDGEVMYIGRCQDNFYSRINVNYGNISPRNCYFDGQSTNCHINSLINNVGESIELWVLSWVDEKEIAEKERILIRKYQPRWNIALK